MKVKERDMDLVFFLKAVLFPCCAEGLTSCAPRGTEKYIVGRGWELGLSKRYIRIVVCVYIYVHPCASLEDLR